MPRHPDVVLIAAVGRSGQLGLDGSIPWRDTADLARFRSVTMGHVLVVGRRTAESLPHLPGRSIHVMSRGETPEEVIQRWKDCRLFVAGGAVIYRLWWEHVRLFDITQVDYDGPADVWFPGWPRYSSSARS